MGRNRAVAPVSGASLSVLVGSQFEPIPADGSRSVFLPDGSMTAATWLLRETTPTGPRATLLHFSPFAGRIAASPYEAGR
jgi:hypothetical protein